MKDVTLEMINDLIKRIEKKHAVDVAYRYYGGFSGAFWCVFPKYKMHDFETKEDLMSIFKKYE